MLADVLFQDYKGKINFRVNIWEKRISQNLPNTPLKLLRRSNKFHSFEVV